MGKRSKDEIAATYEAKALRARADAEAARNAVVWNLLRAYDLVVAVAAGLEGEGGAAAVKAIGSLREALASLEVQLP